MLKLISLHLNNIRCFDSPQTIKFSDRDKLVQIDGKNENTGGSSGAGKTTIPLGLTYLFGVGDIPATLLQSRLTKEPMEVIGEFLINNNKTIISRSKKNGLSILFPDSPELNVSGNSKLAEEKLDELIGIPRKIFKKIIYKKQKEGGFFLNMTSKEVFDFLVKVLELEGYIDKVDRISEDIRKDDDTIKSIAIKKQLILENTEDLRKILESREKPIKTVSKNEIDNLKVKKNEIEHYLNNVNKQIEEEMGSIKKPKENIATVKTIDDSSLIELKKELEEVYVVGEKIENARKDIEFKINSLSFLKKNAKELGETIYKLKKQKEEISKSLCPTCTQKWIGDTADEKIRQLDSEIQSNIDEAITIKKELDNEQEYKTGWSRLLKMYNTNKSEVKFIQSKISEEDIRLAREADKGKREYNLALSEYNDKISKIQSKHDGKVKECMSKLSIVSEEYNKKSVEFNTYSHQLKEYVEENKKISYMIKLKDKEIEELSDQFKALTDKALVGEESKRLIKSFVIQTFQDTLDFVGNMATDILSAIPNMSSSVIYFEPCKETKSGTIKDEVDAIINMDGTNGIPIKSLSGGERTAIDLAVDLAVIDMIENKTGKGADFFIMDEPFDGLDSVCKENCLEILKQIDTNKRIIMVDHSSELKEMVSDVIMVTKNGENSKVS